MKEFFEKQLSKRTSLKLILTSGLLFGFNIENTSKYKELAIVIGCIAFVFETKRKKVKQLKTFKL